MTRRFRLLALSLLLLAGGWPLAPAPAAQAAPLPATTAAPADPAFDLVWARTDQLVRGGSVTRSWYWGDAPFARLAEPYAGAPGGSRLVTYYDKGRMEIPDPAAPRSSAWFVTSGLLVKEMLSGQIAIGPDQTEPRAPSVQPVVGDPGAENPAPTYAILGRFASLGGDANRAPNRVGTLASATLDADGQIGESAALAAEPGTRLGTYVVASGHNIPDVFWNYLQAQGPYLDGRTLLSGRLVDWVYLAGYPITEPYWVRARVGTAVRDVLVQAFERRVLTYTPSNDAGWRVEMGNVGRHYYAWRYGADAPGTLAPPAYPVRISCPQAHLDAPIVPTYVQNHAWQVADYAAGWLYGTAQPGQPGNSVFAGHNNWHGEVFRYLEFLHPGDEFTIEMSDGAIHRYRIASITKVREAGVSPAQIAANAHYMDPTPDERVTLITCWPYTTFTHRLIVIAHPVQR